MSTSSLRAVAPAALALLATACAPHAGTPAPATPASAAAAPAGSAASAIAPLPGAEAPRRLPSQVPFESLEGPFWMAKGGYLLFSDVVEQNGAAARIYRFDPGAGTFVAEPYPVAPTSTNGLGADAAGNLLACERWNGALVRITGGTRTVVADHFPMPGGQTLNAPNDLVVRGDGNVYFTDTVWGARPGAHAAPGVYRVAPDGALSVAYAVNMPNGVALSPDGRWLYVGSDAQNKVWRLPVDAGGAVGAPEVLIDPSRVPGGLFKVPDGICVDDRGDLYVPNNSDDVRAIQVFGPDGAYRGGIALPDRPSNCTFGGPDRRTMYVTTLHAVYEVRVATAGLP